MECRIGSVLIKAFKTAHRSVCGELLKLILETDPSLTLSELDGALNITRRKYGKARDAAHDIDGVLKARKKTKTRRAWSKSERLQYFASFLMRPDNLQQVVYGAHTYQMDFGENFQVSNWIRKKGCFALGRQFKLEVEQMNMVSEVPLKPPFARFQKSVFVDILRIA